MGLEGYTVLLKRSKDTKKMISVSTVTNLVQTTFRSSLDHVHSLLPVSLLPEIFPHWALILYSSYSTHCYILNMVIWSCHLPVKIYQPPIALKKQWYKAQGTRFVLSNVPLVSVHFSVFCSSNTSSSLKFQLSWLDLREVFPAHLLQGGSQFWFRVGTVFWLAFCWFCYYNHTEWPASENSAPLPVKLECLCSEPCPPVDGRKEEINTIPCLRLAIPGYVWRLMAFSLCFRTSLISGL